MPVNDGSNIRITPFTPMEMPDMAKEVSSLFSAMKRASGGGGGLGQQGQVFPVHLTKIQQIPRQDAFRAKARAIDGLDFRMEFCLPHSPQQGAVDDRGGAAAVGDEHISFQHISRSSLTPWSGRRPSCTGGRRPA